MKPFTLFRSFLNVFFFGLFLWACGNEEQSLPIKVDCLTQDASEITTNSAILRGIAIIENANGQEAKAYFYFSPYYTDIEDLKASGTRINAGTVPPEGGTFEATLSGLTGGTSYYYAASVAVDGKEAFGQVGAFMTVSKPAELTVTAEASNITETTAVLYGFANLTEEMSNAEFGIIFSTDENPSADNGKVLKTNELNSDNKYSVKATNLKPATLYYYKSFVSKGTTLRVGDIKTFNTTDYSVAVHTIEASNISLFSSTINGSLQVECVDNLERSVSFIYSNTAQSIEELKKSGNKVSSSLNDDGSFSNNLSNLAHGVTYYYVACARVHEREYYGEVKSFTTDDFNATVITQEADKVELFSGRINGNLIIENGENLEVSVWFLYSDTVSNLESLKTTGKKITSYLYYMDGVGYFPITLSSLDYNTRYYYVACAKVHDKEFYGEIKSFTTTDFSVSVTTNDATNIGLFEASLRGKLITDNAETLSKEVWFLYGNEVSSLESLKTNGIKTAVSLSTDGSFSLNLDDLRLNKTYYYVAVARVYDKDVYGTIKEFTTKNRNVPEGAVELELSVLWADCNIGSSTPEGRGEYYAWGELETKSNYDWNTYKWCNGSDRTLTKYNIDSEYGIVDNKTILELNDDVAHAKLGGNWRMPTSEEFEELIMKCSVGITTKNGQRCAKVTSKKNGNSIYFPLVGDVFYNNNTEGRYWSSSLYIKDPTYYSQEPSFAVALFFSASGSYGFTTPRWRRDGLSIRAVTE